MLVDIFTTDAADPAVRVVVLTGAGTNAFCTGADLGNAEQMNGSDTTELMKVANRVVASIISCPKPVIAAVNGVAATLEGLPAAFDRETVGQVELLATNEFLNAAKAFTAREIPVFSET